MNAPPPLVASRRQKVYFSASWMMRGSPADVINPKFGLFNAETGLFTWTRLSTLNTSARNWTCRSPPMRSDRVSPMSTLNRFGPTDQRRS